MVAIVLSDSWAVEQVGCGTNGNTPVSLTRWKPSPVDTGGKFTRKKPSPVVPSEFSPVFFLPGENPFRDNRESLTPVNSGQIWPTPVKIMYKAITLARLHFFSSPDQIIHYTPVKNFRLRRASHFFRFFLLLTHTDTFFMYTVPHIS